MDVQSHVNTIATIVASKVNEELLGAETRFMAAIDGHMESVVGRLGFERKIREIHDAISFLKAMEERAKTNVTDAMKDIQENVIQSILDFLRNPISSSSPHRTRSPSASVSGESLSEHSEQPSQHTPGDIHVDGFMYGDTPGPTPTEVMQSFDQATAQVIY